MNWGKLADRLEGFDRAVDRFLYVLVNAVCVASLVVAVVAIIRLVL